MRWTSENGHWRCVQAPESELVVAFGDVKPGLVTVTTGREISAHPLDLTPLAVLGPAEVADLRDLCDEWLLEHGVPAVSENEEH
ncbi:MAG: hypothetical protein J0H98_10665 [Solirubrobacterales bacterium]|nr:hypothetical protein [Solirubrobacterales bacterium]